MNNLYLERSLVYLRQEDLVREVRANRVAKRLRAAPQRGSAVRWVFSRGSLLGLRRVLSGGAAGS